MERVSDDITRKIGPLDFTYYFPSPPRFENLTTSLHKMRPDERDIMVKYANESYCGKISLYVMGVFCVEVSLKKHI